MNIGLDLRLVAVGASGGIAMGLQGVLRQMMADHPNDRFDVFCTIFNRTLLGKFDEHVHFHTLPTRTFYQEMDDLAQRHRVDVLFRAFASCDPSRFPAARQIVHVPDLQHEQRPDLLDGGVVRARRAAFDRALNGAGAIGTVSEYSQASILAHRATRCRDVFLMPPALTDGHANVTAAQLSPTERALVPSDAFFYFPANVWPHKNHQRLLRAFAQVAHESVAPLRLVLSGYRRGWDELARQFSRLPVTHIGFVRPHVVRFLYQHALALCFFSEFEGFGIPVIEAFDAGCPVLCANATSLPEVAGDAALMCDPSDVDAIARLMRQVLRNPELRRELVLRGRSRVGRFSWATSAANLYDACQRVRSRKVDDPWPAAGPGARPGLYRRWYHELGFTVPRAWRELKRRGRGKLSGVQKLAQWAGNDADVAQAMDRLAPVRGMWADNWLGPQAQFVIGDVAAGQELWLGGTAAADMDVRIDVDGSPIESRALPAGQYTAMRWTAEQIGRRRLSLRFASHVIDARGRRLSFRIEDTNLFSEDDVA